MNSEERIAITLERIADALEKQNAGMEEEVKKAVNGMTLSVDGREFGRAVNFALKDLGKGFN